MSKRWGSAVNGPDWTDIRVMMGALAKLHECQCYLELAPDGVSEGGAIVIRALLVTNVPVDDLKPAELGVSREWPALDGRTFEACVYELLYQLDHLALKRWWRQGEFNPTA